MGGCAVWYKLRPGRHFPAPAPVFLRGQTLLAVCCPRQWRRACWGPGSNIHTIGSALAMAMNHDRILVLPPNGEEKHLVWYDPQWCPGARGWECWVLPVAGCLPTADSDVKRIEIADLEGKPPDLFQPVLRCAALEYRLRNTSIGGVLSQRRTWCGSTKRLDQHLTPCGRNCWSNPMRGR